MSNEHCPVCGGFLALRTSHTAKNPNRQFLVCHEDGCNYFRWANTSETQAADKVLAIHDAAKVLVRTVRTEWKEDLDNDSPAGGANSSIVNLTNQKEQETKVEFVPPTGEGLSFLPPAPVIAKPSTEFTPSHYQQAVFDFIQQSGSAVVEAVAGSGKTTTIVKALDYTPKDAEVAFAAFNVSIARELQQRVPTHVHASTLHSLANSNLRKAFPDVEIDARKMWKLFDDDYTYNYELKQNAPEILRLTSLCKLTLSNPNAENLDKLCDHYGVLLNGSKERAYNAVSAMYQKSLDCLSTLADFDDQILASALGVVPCQQFDLLLQDEAQDANNAQRELIKRSLKSGGRLIAVGDSFQSIYGFAGAGIDSIERITADFAATTLPLSISYRCPRKVVELARTIVPQIEARDNAPDGIVADLPSAKFLEQVHAGDMVLCRLNAPLVPPAFELIRRGVKAVIRGRDIGKNLMTLVKRIQRRTHEDNFSHLLIALSDYVSRESTKLMLIHKDTQAALLIDQCDTIVALSDHCHTLSELESRINKVFSDDVQGVTFSSVHKAKGLEAQRIFVLNPELMPFPRAKQPWEIKQEANLQYVCWTRSKSELYFIR